jgi:DNA processing protein
VDRKELAGWLRLTLSHGIGDTTARRLLAAFGLPEDIFRQSPAALGELVTPAQVAALEKPPAGLDAQIEQTLRWLQDAGPDGAVRRVLTLGDASYPASLLETTDPPVMLYLLGAAGFDLTQLGQSLAIVGSRNPTPQGEANAKAFARAFVEAGIPVVSGLALGIDGAAHQGALDGAAGVPGRLATVAVVGTGLDRVYPARHRALAHRITAQGLIVSEFALGTPPLNQNFPRRNRIISGLTRGTLVVEAALASGSLITARMAVEQGREVFAIPGSIHSPQSRGCHALIRQGAKLVESVHDVLEELPPESPRAATTGRTQASDVTAPPEAAALLASIGFDPVGLDELVARTGESTPRLQALLLELELADHVARLPGGLFQRQARG